jgi:hypothetical protein
MQHAKKMVLISPEALHQKTTLVTNNNETLDEYVPKKIDPVESLEKEMYSILGAKNTTDRDKWSSYYQLLQRYFRHMNEERKPFTQENDDVTTAEKGMSDESILEAIPPSLQKKANTLLGWINRTGTIKWNDMGEVSVRGNKISGSNIVDLIRDLLTARKISAPTGMREFCVTLKKLNIPNTLIGHPARYAAYTSGYKLGTSMPSTSTPIRGENSGWLLQTPTKRKTPTTATPVSTSSSSLQLLPSPIYQPRRQTKRGRKANSKWASFVMK